MNIFSATKDEPLLSDFHLSQTMGRVNVAVVDKNFKATYWAYMSEAEAIGMAWAVLDKLGVLGREERVTIAAMCADRIEALHSQEPASEEAYAGINEELDFIERLRLNVWAGVEL